MIYTIKVVSIFGAIIAVLTFLPNLVLPDNTVEALSTVISYAYQFNHIVDIDTLLIIFFLFLVSEATLILWRGFKFFLFLFK